MIHRHARLLFSLITHGVFVCAVAGCQSSAASKKDDAFFGTLCCILGGSLVALFVWMVGAHIYYFGWKKTADVVKESLEKHAEQARAKKAAEEQAARAAAAKREEEARSTAASKRPPTCPKCGCTDVRKGCTGRVPKGHPYLSIVHGALVVGIWMGIVPWTYTCDKCDLSFTYCNGESR